MSARFGVTRQLIDYEDYAGEAAWAGLANRLLTGIAVISLVAAGALLLAYLVLATAWQSQPFIGVFFANPNLKIEDAETFTNEAWSGDEAGLQAGDTIIAFNGVDMPADERNGALDDLLQEAEIGQNVEVVFLPHEDHDTSRMNCSGEGACLAFLSLRTIPLIDFLIYFGIGYASAVVILAMGAAVLWRRPDTRATRLFAISAATLSIFSAGQFDTISSFSLTWVWLCANYLFAGTLVSFALSFPYDLGTIRRAPALRYAPMVLGLVASIITLILYNNDRYTVLHNASLAAQLIAVIAVAVIMGVRWRRATSPVIREQVVFVGAGAIAAFLLTSILTFVFIATNGQEALHELVPVTRLSLMLFSLSFAYATLQYRLLESDKIIPEAVVYLILTGLLLIGYSLVTLGLATLGITLLDADSPILIAATIGVIVLAFSPVRNYLRDLIDKALFQKRTIYQGRIETFMRGLTNAVNMNEVYARVKRELDETITPNQIFMFVYNNKENLYIAMPQPGETIPATDVTFETESGLVKYLQAEQSVLYLEAGQPLPVQVASDRAKIGILTTPLLMSLRGRGRLNGILAIGARRNRQPFAYEDLRYLENVVDQSSLAVERARFVDELEQQVLYQEVFSKVSNALNYGIDFETLLELIFAQTSRVINADHFYIVSYDEYSQELYHTFYSIGDERIERLENDRWAIGEGLIAQVITSQSPLRVNQFTKEQNQRNPLYKQPGNATIYAWIGAPMISDSGGILGVMAVGSTNSRVTFTDDQTKLMHDIANVTASAMDKTRLFQKTQLRAAQLKALNDISSQLASELENLDKLLQTITQNAVDILGCEAGSLLLLDESRRELIFRVVTGGSGENLIGKRIPRDESSLVANAVNQIEPIIVNHPERDDRWGGEIDPTLEEAQTKEFHSRAILTVPLVAQGEAVGALQLINKRGGANFDAEDANMATTFAGQAAIAIQNARLFESQDQQLLLRVQELESMAHIDQELNQTVVLDELVNIIMEIAMSQTHATHGAFLLLDENEENLNIIASYNYPEDSLLYKSSSRRSVSTEHGIWGRVVTSGKPNVINITDQDPQYKETVPLAQSQMAVPIIVGADTRGVVLVETTHTDQPMSLLQLNSLTRIVDRASSAVSNAMLYSRLADQQKARIAFMNDIAHELKKPVAAVKGYTDLVRRGVTGQLNPQQSDFLNRVYRNADQLEQLLNDIRELGIMQANPNMRLELKLEAVDFVEVAKECVETVQQDFEEKEQTIETQISPDLPLIWAERRRVVQIVLNFLTNANKYTPDEGHIILSAELAENIWDAQGARQVVHIAIKDNGLGISEEDQKRLFEQYFRSTNQTALKESGTGLGLALTRNLILQHGGTIWFESAINVGTTFHFTIPVAAEMAPA